MSYEKMLRHQKKMIRNKRVGRNQYLGFDVFQDCKKIHLSYPPNTIESKLQNIYDFKGIVSHKKDLEITQEHINKSFEEIQVEGVKYLLCFEPESMKYKKL